MYAYAGFPYALNGLATLVGVVEERKGNTINDPVGEGASAIPADKSSLEVGEAVQTELAGQPVAGPLFDLAPAINTYCKAICSETCSGAASWIFQAVKSSR